MEVVFESDWEVQLEELIAAFVVALFLAVLWTLVGFNLSSILPGSIGALLLGVAIIMIPVAVSNDVERANQVTPEVIEKIVEAIPGLITGEIVGGVAAWVVRNVLGLK